MEEVLQTCLTLLDQQEPFVLSAIVDNTGSAPRHVGTVMLVRADGSIVGTIGGGLLEAQVIAAAPALYQNQGGKRIPYHLGSTDITKKDSMICGGNGQIVMLYITREHRDVFADAMAAVGCGRDGFLLIFCPERAGDPWLISFAEDTAGETGLPPAAEGYTRYAMSVTGGGRLILFGAGHVSREIAPLCVRLGFQVVVMDDRPDFANEQCFPGCTTIVLEDMSHLPELTLIDRDFIIIATRGHLHDRSCLEWALRTGSNFIGMMGSKRKRALIFEKFREDGVSEQDIARIRTPIGIEIGAETPVEIAVSVAAELIRVRAARQGAPKEKR